jgi:hypothetical protein
VFWWLIGIVIAYVIRYNQTAVPVYNINGIQIGEQGKWSHLGTIGRGVLIGIPLGIAIIVAIAALAGASSSY